MHGSGVSVRRRLPDLHKKLPLLRDMTGLSFDADDATSDELTQVGQWHVGCRARR
jgi:hypothetical protein